VEESIRELRSAEDLDPIAFQTHALLSTAVPGTAEVAEAAPHDRIAGYLHRETESPSAKARAGAPMGVFGVEGRRLRLYQQHRQADR